MVESRARIRAVSAVFGGALAGIALAAAPMQAMAERPAQASIGGWVHRVQVIHDQANGSVERVRLRAWSPGPADALEFVFEPEGGSAFDPSAGDGAITGRGKLVWRVRGSASYDNRTIHAVYTGELAEGRPHGRGRMEMRSGEVLEGVWAAGRLHGEGVLTHADGTRTEAAFVDGLAQGVGRQTRADGSIYRGGFRDGLRHGEATLRMPGGTTYASRWRDGVEISGQRPDALADAMVGGLLRAQSGGGDAGKVELTVSVDQRMTRQASMKYTHEVNDDHIAIYPQNPGMTEMWLGKETISPNSYDSIFGYVDWEDSPSFLEVGMQTTDTSVVLPRPNCRNASSACAMRSISVKSRIWFTEARPSTRPIAASSPTPGPMIAAIPMRPSSRSRGSFSLPLSRPR